MVAPKLGLSVTRICYSGKSSNDGRLPLLWFNAIFRSENQSSGLSGKSPTIHIIKKNDSVSTVFLWCTLLTRYFFTHVIYFIQVCRWKPLKSSGFHPNLHDFRCMRLTTLSPTFRVRGSGGQKATCQDIGYLTRVSASVSRSLLLKWNILDSMFCWLDLIWESGGKGWRVCNLSSISRFSSTLLYSWGRHVDPPLCGYQTPRQQEKAFCEMIS